MEAKYSLDSFLISIRHIQYFLLIEFSSLGGRFFGSNIIRNVLYTAIPMVLCFCSSSILRIFFWLQKRNGIIPNKNKSNPKKYSDAGLVYASSDNMFDRWYFTIRSCFRGIVLHHVSSLVTSNLLYFRVFVLGYDSIGSDLCRNFYFIVLLPAVQ